MSSRNSAYFWNVMVHIHSKMDGNVPTNSTIFIGDSITQALCTDSVITPSVNFGIAGDLSPLVLQRIEKYKSLARAKTVVLAIGTNDLNLRLDNQIATIIKKIVKNIPTADIVLSAVLPYDEKRNAYWRVNKRNKRIQKLNLLLKAIPGIRFFDCGDDLVDSKGNLDVRYHIGDGLHLNTAGYNVYIAKLKEFLPA